MPSTSASEKELLEINSQIQYLVQTVSEQFQNLKSAIDSANFDQLKPIIANDQDVDAIESRIDELSMRYVQNRAPLGASLRYMFGCIDVAHALERIGDCIEYVARHIYGNQDLRSDFPEGWSLVSEMTTRAQHVFDKAISSLSSKNVLAARSVPKLDDIVNAMQDQGYKITIESVRSKNIDIELALHFVLIVNKLESIGDIACHIARKVVYIVDDANIRHQK